MKTKRHDEQLRWMNAGVRSLKAGLKSAMASISDRLDRDVLSHPSIDGKIVFGPVPSRRLGFSLGINNIKRKICSYDCIYCQAGRTTSCSTCRDYCLSPYELYFVVKKKIGQLQEEHVHFDFISFVPSGEPTLDNNLSKEIALLREFGYKIAVFTNSSHLWNDNVQENLMFADYVSVKIDTANEATWNTMNRPHRRLRFDTILNGIAEFAKRFEGTLTTETMLVKNVNDTVEEIRQIGSFLKTFQKDVSYFTIPVRPPAESYAVPPDDKVLEELERVINKEIPQSEMLCCPESGDFKATGDIEQELLGILSVHPMKEKAVERLLKSRGAGKANIKRMIHSGSIHKVIYDGKGFYVGSPRGV